MTDKPIPSWEKNKDCCCNCVHQIELRKHPWNKEFGKGSISESCGYVCISPMYDLSKFGFYSDNKHGMCELHIRKKDSVNCPTYDVTPQTEREE